MIKNSNVMPNNDSVCKLRCPNCKKAYWRVYKDYEDGFGYCVACSPPVKLVKASDLLEERKIIKAKEDFDRIDQKVN